MKKTLAMSVICALAVAAVTPVAFAQQEPTREAYRQAPIPPTLLQDLEGPPPSVSADESPSAEGPPAADEAPRQASGDTLPFTGLDIAIVALMGVALLGTGAAMRRAVRPPQT